MSMTPNAGHGLRNPIIGDTTGDTLYQVECCLSFISRVHEDLADWQGAMAMQSGGPDAMNVDQHRGLALLIECVRSAVLHEMERGDA
ncbi:MAG TPA: hypothetical protein DCL01_01405 [Thauera sp.]|nr:hypothetical protein [Thauera sp.]HHW65775.1 hypothetical protein [Rhodocyclaceae bacterium]